MKRDYDPIIGRANEYRKVRTATKYAYLVVGWIAIFFFSGGTRPWDAGTCPNFNHAKLFSPPCLGGVLPQGSARRSETDHSDGILRALNAEEVGAGRNAPSGVVGSIPL